MGSSWYSFALKKEISFIFELTESVKYFLDFHWVQFWAIFLSNEMNSCEFGMKIN